MIDKGSTYMSSAAGVQAEIADVITGVILLFSACTAFIKYRVARMEEKTENPRFSASPDLNERHSAQKGARK